MPRLHNALHVIDSLAPGGSERVLVELVNALWSANTAVCVCVTRSDMQLASDLHPDIPVLELGRLRTWDWSAVATLCRYCAAQNVRILHAHGRSTILLCAVVKSICRVKPRLIFHDHYGEIAVDKSASAQLQLVCKTLVDHYIAVSPELQQWAIFRLHLKPSNTSLLVNAINLSRFDQAQPLDRQNLGLMAQPLCGVFVANLRPQKDHHLLFHALAKSREARHVLHVLLVGYDREDMYSRSCHALIEELGIQNNITFAGRKCNVASILKAADLGLLASRSESGPIALLEYMAANLPFVATRTGSIAQQAYESGLQYFVEPSDVGGYTAALDELVALSPDKRLGLGVRGRQTVMHIGDISKQTERLLGLYESILDPL